MTNQYTDTSRMLKSLHNSFTLKVKHHWSRDTGAGFITEDITDIQPSPNGLRFTFGWGCQVLKTSELNLRETEEAIKFLENRALQELTLAHENAKVEQSTEEEEG